jgi:hypothetical protein
MKVIILTLCHDQVCYFNEFVIGFGPGGDQLRSAVLQLFSKHFTDNVALSIM